MRWNKLQLYTITFENFNYDKIIQKEKSHKENMKHKKYKLKHKEKKEKEFSSKVILRKKKECI